MTDFIGTEAKSKKKMDEKNHKKIGQSFSKRAKKTFSSKDTGNFKQYKNGVRSNIVCFRYGKNHLASSCSLPRSVKCLECGGFDHLSIVCKKKEQTNYVEDIAAIEKAYEHSDH